MNVELNNKSIVYNVKEYALEGVKVTIVFKNKYEGIKILIPLVLLYILSFFVVFSPPVYDALFDYLFVVYGLQWVSFMWLIFIIHNRYFLEVATIQLSKDSKLRIPYSRERKLIVNRIITMSGNVEYVSSK